jgi:hypothetical protein
MQTVMANYNSTGQKRHGVNNSQDVQNVYIVNNGEQLKISSTNFNKPKQQTNNNQVFLASTL